MDRADLLDCMREAAAALAEFRHLLPAHSLEADRRVVEARRHFEHAIRIVEASGKGCPFMRLAE